MAYQSIYTGAQIDDAIGKVMPHTDGLAGIDSEGKVAAEQASSSIVSVTGNRTLQLSDAGKMLIVDSSSAVTLTVPAGGSVAFPAGTEIEILRKGSGTVTLAAATGVSILSVGNSKKLGDQYSTAGLKLIGSDLWILAGGLG